MQIKNPLDIAINHGLTKSEYKQIIKSLKREPNLTEIGILGAMWSEHCSYKALRFILRHFLLLVIILFKVLEKMLEL